QYTGYDVSPTMVAAARERHAATPDCHLTDDRAMLTPADYPTASGLRNAKVEADSDESHGHFLRTLASLGSPSACGVTDTGPPGAGGGLRRVRGARLRVHLLRQLGGAPMGRANDRQELLHPGSERPPAVRAHRQQRDPLQPQPHLPL